MRRSSRARREALARKTKRLNLRQTGHLPMNNFQESPKLSRKSRSSMRAVTGRKTRAMPAFKSYEELDALDEAPFALDKPLQIEGRGAISPQELDQIVDENRSLKQLHQIISFLGSFSRLDELIPEIVDLGLKLTGLSRGVLATVEGEEGEHCRLKMLRGWKRAEQTSPNFQLTKKMITLSAKDERPYFITDLNAQKASRNRSKQPTIQTIIALPLQDNGDTFGVLVFADETNRGEFNRSERELLTNYARHASLLFSKLNTDATAARRNKDMERSHRALKGRLDAACQRIRELKSPETKGGLLKDAKTRFYKNYLAALVKKNRGSFTRAAEEAGISRDELIALLQKYRVLKR